MEVQVNLEKLVLFTREQLHVVQDENAVLQVAVMEQQEEIQNLKAALDMVNEEVSDGQERKQALRAVGEAGRRSEDSARD